MTCWKLVSLEKKLEVETDPGKREVLAEMFRCLTLSVYGKGRYTGDTHRWGFTERTLLQVMTNAKFKTTRQLDMISGHHTQEDVILVRGVKIC